MSSAQVGRGMNTSRRPFQGCVLTGLQPASVVQATVGARGATTVAMAKYRIVDGEVILNDTAAPAPAAAPAPPVLGPAAAVPAPPALEPAAAAPAPPMPEPLAPNLQVDILDAPSQTAGALTSADVSGAASEAFSGASEAILRLTSSVGASVTDLGGSITSSVTGLGGAIGDGLGGLGGTVGGGVEVASEAVGGALSLATSALSETAGVVGDTIDTVTKGASQALGEVTATISDTVDAVASSTTGLVLQVEQAVGDTTQQVWAAIPPEAQDLLLQAGAAAASMAGLAAEYPLPVLGVAGTLVVPAVVQSYSSRFGGYAGELAAPDARELLSSEEPALLLDIRPEVVREKDGLPELKLGARFKAVALPLSVAQDQVARANPQLLRLVASREALALDTLAAFVAGLKQLSTPLTKVVVMDRDGGEQAREVARALRRGGLFSAYVLQGGFKGWVAAELPTTTQRGVEYDATAADLINDKLEVLANKAGELATQLSNPAVGVPVVGGAALLAVAVYKYEITLQLIGLAGLSWSAYSELSKYDSPQAAVAAWTSAAKKLLTPKPKPQVVNGKAVPEGFVPPKLPAPPAAARAEEVLARAAQELAEAETSRKAELAAMAAAAIAEATSSPTIASVPTSPAANGVAAVAAPGEAGESSAQKQEGSLEVVK